MAETAVNRCVGRREEYAEATRQAIIVAARKLFRTQGVFCTKVDEIAALARVSPATVYAVGGGKQGLLRTLIESCATAPIVAATVSRIEELDDPQAILCLLAAVVRSMCEEFGDIMRVMLDTAPHDEAVAESLATATANYRDALELISRRLSKLGALRDGLEVNQAIDVSWFYFGYSGLLNLHDENGWTYQRAERWLCEEASRALLRDPTSCSPQELVRQSPDDATHL